MKTNCFVPFTQIYLTIFEDLLIDDELVFVDELPDLLETAKGVLLVDGKSLLADTEVEVAEIEVLGIGACLTSPIFKMNLCPFS